MPKKVFSVAELNNKITIAFYNNTEEKLTTGEHFTIEKWDGKIWKNVISKTDPPRIFVDIGYWVMPFSKIDIPTNILWYYPSATAKGRYRITKQFTYDKDRPITPDERHYVSSEYEIK